MILKRQYQLLYSLLVIIGGLESVAYNARWGLLEFALGNIAEVVVEKLSTVLDKLEKESNVSSDCISSLSEFGTGLTEMQSWAFQMLDATGKIPSGFMEGSFMELGSYDQCLRVTARSGNASFTGMHCAIRLNMKWKLFLRKEYTSFRKLAALSSDLPIEVMNDYHRMEVSNVIIGLCVPSRCNEQDIWQMSNILLDKYFLPMHLSKINCETKSEERKWEFSEILACIFFGAILLLVFIGTAVDMLSLGNKIKSSKLNLILKGFSFYSNAKIFANSDVSKTFQCFNGLKILSLFWVILSHMLFMGIPDQLNVFKPLSTGLKFSQNLIMSIVDNASPSVDTFFLISGFLLTYSTWKILEANNGKINIISFLFRKYWRLTPPLCATIMLTILLPRFGNGPLWKENSTHLAKLCQENGWKNIMHLQNLFSVDTMCLNYTWYIACLMQFIIIAILLILLCYRYFSIGLTMGILLISIGATLSMTVTALFNLTPAPLYSSYGIKPMMKHVTFQLIKPHNHIGAYIIGMALGYIFLKHRNKPMKKSYVIMAWTAAIFAMLGVVFGVQSFRTQKTYGSLSAVLYSGFSRIVWASAVAWLSFACITDRGGFINDALSWSPFAFLARLSYAAYLLHPLVICYHTSQTRSSYYFNYFTLGHCYIFFVVITFFFSYFFHLIIEMPFANLEKLLLHRKVTRIKDS